MGENPTNSSVDTRRSILIQTIKGGQDSTNSNKVRTELPLYINYEKNKTLPQTISLLFILFA